MHLETASGFMKKRYIWFFSLSYLSLWVAVFSYKDNYETLIVEDQKVKGIDQKILVAANDYLSVANAYMDPTCPESEPVLEPACPLPSPGFLSPFHKMHVSIRHNEGRGIGYEDGYTTLEAFRIDDTHSEFAMPFLDIRGHVFNNGKLAGSIGIGGRGLIESINQNIGVYFYYDVRRVGKGLTANQLSPGIELVGKRMEYRVNGYFPVGKVEGHKYDRKFEENSIRSKRYHTMTGFDSEVGLHLTQSTKYDIYAGAGPYYFQTSRVDSWGGRARLLGRYKEYITLELAYSYDHLFNSIVQGSVALTFPFGPKLKRDGSCCPDANDLLLSRAAFAPSRLEIPVVKTHHRNSK